MKYGRMGKLSATEVVAERGSIWGYALRNGDLFTK